MGFIQAYFQYMLIEFHNTLNILQYEQSTLLIIIYLLLIH